MGRAVNKVKMEKNSYQAQSEKDFLFWGKIWSNLLLTKKWKLVLKTDFVFDESPVRTDDADMMLIVVETFSQGLFAVVHPFTKGSMGEFYP